MPTAAVNIATQTFVDITSFKNKKPNNAVIKGMAARQSKVIAALVWVIDHMKEIIAVPSPAPPIKPDKPIFL